jgi:predicted DNA-binding protein (UPF0251 family)
MNQKVLIFDASSLISLVMNGLLPEFKELKRIFKGKFIITEEVKHEIIDKPITIKKFEFEALRLKDLIDKKILEMPSSLGISNELISKKTNEVMKVANNIFYGRGRNIRIIDSGESSCLALSRMLNEKKIENVIVIDERTTRMLGEKPENLERLLRKKLHTDVEFKKENFKIFGGFKFIRSSELVYVMYKKEVIKLKNNVLDALLYAVKFKGCAISGDEIKEIKRIG